MDKNVYQSSTEYIQDELTNVKLILKLVLLEQINQINGKNWLVDFLGFDQEILSFLNISDNDLNNQTQVIEYLYTQQKNISEKLYKTNNHGIVLPINTLKDKLGLSAIELYVLFICLAYEINPIYGEIYAYINNDKDKPYPTPQLIFKLLNQIFGQEIYIRNFFSNNMPLIKWQLINLDSNNYESNHDFFQTAISVDKYLLNWLLDHPKPGRELDQCISSKNCPLGFDDLYLNKPTKTILTQWSNHLRSKQNVNQTLLFYGEDQLSHLKAALAIANSLDLTLIELNLINIVMNPDPVKLLDQLVRDIVLKPAAIFVYPCELLLTENPKIIYFAQSLIKALQNYCKMSVLSMSIEYKQNDLFNDFPQVHFDLPGYALRKEIWECSLDNYYQYLNSISVSKLANIFFFSESQIQKSINKAIEQSIFYNHQERKENFDQVLLESCKQQSNHRLTDLAVKVKSKYQLKDHVNYKSTLNQLKEIIRFYQNRLETFDVCGIDNNSTGKGLHVLFTGDPGTGKTMAASVLANTLKLDLYKIDLSKIVDKYIGETEKNISKIFDEAKRSNVILFFDEADALFAARSQVKDSRDRYANIEVSHLLQKMEEYSGISILASNMGGGIDKAFTRRLHYIVVFSRPDLTKRKLLWQKMFAKNTIVAQDLDYDFLAKNLQDISGADIRNIALKATVQALDENSCITMNHIMMAAFREYKKIGKHISESNFKDYYAPAMLYDYDKVF